MSKHKRTIAFKTYSLMHHDAWTLVFDPMLRFSVLRTGLNLAELGPGFNSVSRDELWRPYAYTANRGELVEQLAKHQGDKFGCTYVCYGACANTNAVFPLPWRRVIYIKYSVDDVSRILVRRAKGKLTSDELKDEAVRIHSIMVAQMTKMGYWNLVRGGKYSIIDYSRAEAWLNDVVLPDIWNRIP